MALIGNHVDAAIMGGFNPDSMCSGFITAPDGLVGNSKPMILVCGVIAPPPFQQSSAIPYLESVGNVNRSPPAVTNDVPERSPVPARKDDFVTVVHPRLNGI